MNKKFKVLTLVGTRPEIIKMSRVMALLDEHVDQTIMHTGQNFDYELNQIFFDQLKIRKPDFFLDVAADTVADTIANVISRSDKVMEEVKPDAMLLLGDTNSCLAVISAKRRQIPIFHMEAGNRCFDQRVPEELNRTLVDHLSDINFPYTEHARRYLINEGIKPQTIIKTGSPMPEVLRYHADDIDSSDVLQRLNLTPGEYFVASMHREENVDSPEQLTTLLNILNVVSEKYNKRIIVSTHPRTKIRLENLSSEVEGNANVEFMKPLGFIDYVHLQKNSFCVLSDSGTITEESAIVGFPAVMVRNAHERPEGQDAGVVIMGGLNLERVLQAIDSTVLLAKEGVNPSYVDDYAMSNVSLKILKAILGYTDYVNRFTWFKKVS